MAKSFDPLAYFLKNNYAERKADDTLMIDEQENTHVTSCLRDAGFRVSAPLVSVKKMTMGLRSILHNQ